MLQYREPIWSYDSVFFELNLEVTPMMLYNEPSQRDRSEPLVEESSTATGGEDPEHVAPLLAQHDAPRSAINAPQPETPRPASSQSDGLTNALAALRVHDAPMPDYEAEWKRLNKKSAWFERSSLKLFQATLVLDLFNIKIQRLRHQNFHLR